MPSTFTENTGIELIADGEQSGLWGQTTNDNFDIIDRALNGSVNISLSGTTHTLTTASGVLSDGQFAVLVFTGSPSGTNTVTIEPNTAQKTYFVTNSTAQTVILSQGSGANVSVPAGLSKIVFTNGAGAGAAVFDITNTLSGTFTGNLTGNASTATALQTARTIGGVSFNGTANINLPGVNIGGNQNTTGSAASLTTARTFTIGATGKTFNGTANVAWSLAEIGVGTLGQQAANNANITGGTINGTVIGGSVPAAISGTTGSFSGDATIHGATVGRGGGAISTNTAVGSGALSSNTTGFQNTANGVSALLNNTTGGSNTANGFNTLFNNTTGGANTATGRSALQSNTTGGSNTANGFQALFNNTEGSNNTANGVNALLNNTTGNLNTANGVSALLNNTTGAGNTVIGQNAGSALTTGNDNTIIGRIAGTAGLANTVIIGAGTAERLRIDAAGNVGIGTSSPAAKLHVETAATEVLRITSNNASNTCETLLRSAGGAGNNTRGRIVGGFQAGGSNFGGFLAFNTTTTQNLNTERLRITNTGNVGIGTSSPAARLHVLGSDGNVFVGDNQQLLDPGTVNTGAIYFGGANAANPTAGIEASFGGATTPQLHMGVTRDGNKTRYSAFFDNTLRMFTANIERMRINSAGNVGIGTSSPAAKLHAARSFATPTGGIDGNIDLIASNTSGASGLGIFGSNTGFSFIHLGDTDNANVGQITYAHSENSMRFVVNAGERMRISSAGDLLLGTTTFNVDTTGARLGPSGAAMFVRAGAEALFVGRRTSNGDVVSIFRDSTKVGSINVNTTTTSYNTSSDYRLKEDVQPMVGASDRVLSLKPCNFAWKADGSRVDGFLAHEAQEIVPAAVTGEKDGEEMQAIDHSKLVPLLTAALQDALKRIEALEAQLNP